MNKLSVIALLIFSSVLSLAQNIDYTAEIDTSRVLIGDQSNLSLTISYPQDLNLDLPIFTDSIIDKIEIVSQTPFDTISTANGYFQVQKILRITSFDSNLYYIPPFEIEYINSDNQEDIVVSNSLSYHVFTIPIDSTNQNALVDIKKIKETPFNFEEFMYYLKKYFPYILSLVLLIGLIVFVVLYFDRQKRKQVPKEPSKPKEPAEVIAYRELNQLKAKKLLVQGKQKEYHTLVSEIIRRYIENRFQLLALEETSSVLISEIKKGKLVSLENIVRLQDLLQISDLVKFAKYEANDYENETVLKNAYLFVDHTKQEEVEVPKVSTEVKNEETN